MSFRHWLGFARRLRGATGSALSLGQSLHFRRALATIGVTLGVGLGCSSSGGAALSSAAGAGGRSNLAGSENLGGAGVGAELGGESGRVDAAGSAGIGFAGSPADNAGGASSSAGGAGVGGAGVGGAGAGGAGAIVESVDIADVWSGQPVNFTLLTHQNQQFVAFYDKDENMTVASRTLGNPNWTLARLASKLGWDSHNYVTMAVDEAGFLHVSGNMHVNPLVYFRSTRALDVTSFVRVGSMIGSNEQSCTYPLFFKGPKGNLVFGYRDGSSGDGNYIFNSYDTASRSWMRLLNTPLADGQGQRNAYPVGPIQGPDGFWHLVWVWRETPDASTNHDLSYAKTQDLLNWQGGGGRTLSLPITLASADIVDPVPQMDGMINNNTKVGFDAQNRAIVSYQKYDSAGNTQIYNARFENGAWVSHRSTSWTYRWSFSGSGSLIFEIEFEPVRLGSDGALYQEYTHVKLGQGTLRLDPTTLEATATLPPQLPYPASLDAAESKTPGMVTQWATDSGVSADPTVQYLLRWETLPQNRDQPRATVPPATPLRLYGFRR